jgi:hypothetical protein
MNIVEILFSQNEIIAQVIVLLVVAGTFGYVIAIFFSKSLYLKKMQVVKADKAALLNKMINLNSDKRKLHNNIREKEHEIIFLYKELHIAGNDEAVSVYKANHLSNRPIEVDSIAELLAVEPNFIDHINWVNHARGLEKNTCVQY